MIARCAAMRWSRTAWTLATTLTWAETASERISRETSLPLTRVHGSSGSVHTSIVASVVRAATSCSSAVSTPTDISHQVSARYIAPVSR